MSWLLSHECDVLTVLRGVTSDTWGVYGHVRSTLSEDAEAGIRDWSVTGVQMCVFLFQAEDGIRDWSVTGVQTCALPISSRRRHTRLVSDWSSDVCSSDLRAHV